MEGSGHPSQLAPKAFRGGPVLASGRLTRELNPLGQFINRLQQIRTTHMDYGWLLLSTGGGWWLLEWLITHVVERMNEYSFFCLPSAFYFPISHRPYSQ
jgi:hypothetical protein